MPLLEIHTYADLGRTLTKEELDNNFISLAAAVNLLDDVVEKITPKKIMVFSEDNSIQLPAFIEAAGLPPDTTVDDITILTLIGIDDRAARIVSIDPDKWVISRNISQVELVYILNH